MLRLAETIQIGEYDSRLKQPNLSGRFPQDDTRIKVIPAGVPCLIPPEIDTLLGLIDSELKQNKVANEK